MRLQQAAPGNYPARVLGLAYGTDRFARNSANVRTMVKLGRLPGAACCQPIDLPTGKAAPLPVMGSALSSCSLASIRGYPLVLDSAALQSICVNLRFRFFFAVRVSLA
jgi:hypothetical protein